MKNVSTIFNMFVTLINKQYKQFMQVRHLSITLGDQWDISVTRAKSREHSLDLENTSKFPQGEVFKQTLAQR